VFLIAAVIGSQRLPLAASLCALTGRSNCGVSPEQQAILFDLRLPRDLLAGAVGRCLAAAGAGYQALLRNPLAEPYLLGVSNGAAVGTMTALVFFGAYEWSRPLMAFAGALAATFVVYQLARGRAGATPERLILAGIIVTTFLSSAIVFITKLMDATRIRSFTFWLLGGLSGTTSRLLGVALVGAAIGVGILVMNARSLNLMMLGERDALRSRRRSWKGAPDCVCRGESAGRRVRRVQRLGWLRRLGRTTSSAIVVWQRQPLGDSRRSACRRELCHRRRHSVAHGHCTA